LGYPLADVVGDRLCTRQYFERGYMLWVDVPQDPNVIWAAVIPNPTGTSGSRSYRLADTWPGSPEYWCSAAEANAPLGPKRGFGMQWCNSAELQSGLGLAREAELGGPDYPRCALQSFQGGAMVHVPLDARYWVFVDGGGWYRFDE
jgi:hypothetical protein